MRDPGNLMFSNEPVKGKPAMKNTLTSVMIAGDREIAVKHLGHGNVEVTITSAELLNMTDDELVERRNHLLTELEVTEDELVERRDHRLAELEVTEEVMINEQIETLMIDKEENLDMMLNEQPDNSDGSDVFLSVPPNMNIGYAADILAYCMSMYPNNDVSFYQGPLDLRRNYVDNTISLVVSRERLKNANVGELVEYIRRHYPEYALQLSIN